MDDVFDSIIIGGGPAGLAAAVYTARGKMSTLLFEKGVLGGQISITHELANYPGFFSDNHDELNPKYLIDKMEAQAKSFGAQIEKKTVTEVRLNDKIKEIVTSDGQVYKAKSVIVATGAGPRKLGCIGEREYTGKGISYCATCDADFFTDLEVFCVGGGDTAVEEAMYLTRFARKVTLIVRKDYLRAAASIIERAEQNPKLEIKYRTNLLEVKGDGAIESARFLNNETNEEWEYKVSDDDGIFGVFIFVGYDPVTQLFDGMLDMKDGFIVADEFMKTNIEGVFAAGDLRPKMFKQVVTAVSDGAIAAMASEKYVAEHFG